VDGREEHYVISSGGLRVDYFENNYGAGFQVSRAYASGCC